MDKKNNKEEKGLSHKGTTRPSLRSRGLHAGLDTEDGLSKRLGHKSNRGEFIDLEALS